MYYNVLSSAQTRSKKKKRRGDHLAPFINLDWYQSTNVVLRMPYPDRLRYLFYYSISILLQRALVNEMATVPLRFRSVL